MPWENDPIVQETSQAAPWESDPIVDEAPKALSSADIDPNLEAPAGVRARVGALDKPEDRLTALRKSYPDAQPYSGDNFIMTDPATGKTIIYNKPGWIPSMGDFASLIPEAGEAAGAVGGAVLGAIGGSAAPVVGTTAGAIGGAGTGATIGREAAQRSANYLFGNEDTRTGGEQAWDAAKTFGLNAGGEGLGLIAAPLVSKAARGVSNSVKDGPRRFVAGQADDPALAAQRAADFRGVGVEPTAGMVSGAPNTALKEQALAATRAGQQIQDRIGQAFGAMDNEAGRIVGDINPQTLTRQELGQALKDQSAAYKSASKARNDYLYDQVGKLTGDAPASGTNTRQFLDELQAERKTMGKSAVLNNGKSLDSVIEQTQAIVDDIGSGINFNTLKQARTNIGAIANDPGVDQVLRDRAQGLYTALAKDMGETAQSVGGDAFQAWKKANNRFRRTSDPTSIYSTKNSLDPILKAQTPEQAADWVLGQVNKGGTRINSVRRQIERTEGGSDLWNTLTGSTVERMGVDASGNFNPTRMLQGWAKMSDEAKDAMFHGTARSPYRQDLDRLARVADNMKSYRRMDNHSNTTKAANALSAMNPFDKTTLIGSLFVGPKAFAISAAGKGANYSYKRWQAKMLTSPETVRWLSQIPREEMSRGGLKGHLKQLGKVAASTSDNALAVAINDYFREIGYSE
ncbi:hypothetical protein [Rhizobium altiplani]|nr:hypothetical protein [Rhizobium altiplani]